MMAKNFVQSVMEKEEFHMEEDRKKHCSATAVWEMEKLTGSKRPQVKDLKPGELICDKCEGWGCIPPSHELESNEISASCEKCQGAGKVDWIANITGVPPPNEFDTSYFVTFAAKELADAIDKEILESVIKESYEDERASLSTRILGGMNVCTNNKFIVSSTTS